VPVDVHSLYIDDEERINAALGRIICKPVTSLSRNRAALLTNSVSLRAYIISTASYSGTRKAIWDHYNDMAREVDTLREIEITELTDTVLVFVNSTLRFIV